MDDDAQDPYGVATSLEQFYKFKQLAEHSKRLQEGIRDNLLEVIEDAVARGEDGFAWTDPTTGSQFIRLPRPVTDLKQREIGMIKREKRTSTPLLEDKAWAWLEEHDLLGECTETITVLNEEAVIALNFSERIPDDVFKSFYDEKVTWAFVQVEGEAPDDELLEEVEQGER